MARTVPAKATASSATRIGQPATIPWPWLALLLFVLVWIAYLPALHCGFIWDDDRYVTENDLLATPGGLGRLWFSRETPSQYFPLTYTTFWIERSLWGLNPAGYHAVNILLHALNAVLAWRLLVRLNIPGAWLGAALFALHPVQVESVAWITERKNVLSLLFYLLALLAWLEFCRRDRRRWTFYQLSLAAFLLALLAKTTACTLPAALLLVLWLNRKPITRRTLAQVTPFVAVGLAMGLFTVWWERYHQGTSGGLFHFGPAQRVLIASRAIWFYLAKLFWPMNLTFSYPRWTIRTSDFLAYVWPVALVAAAIMIWLARKRAGRALETAALFYAATLSPLLGFIMLYTFRYSFVADHYQYVASIGPLALAAAGLTRALDRFAAREFVKPAAATILCATLMTLTHNQIAAYRNLETLWRDTIRKNPSSWLAHQNLGVELERSGRLDEAWSEFTRAQQLEPDYCESYNGFGNVLLRRNRPAEAIGYFQESLARQPGFPEAENNLGIALGMLGKFEEAATHFSSILQAHPFDAKAHANLGNALRMQRRLDEAIPELRESLRLDPTSASAAGNLGLALEAKGLDEQAVTAYEQSLRLDPKDSPTFAALGRTLVKLHRYDEAGRALREALRLQPDNADARKILEALQPPQ
jgi:tetratricopeptide (TPR) repeat protein